jgi:hypothetical protein
VELWKLDCCWNRTEPLQLSFFQQPSNNLPQSQSSVNLGGYNFEILPVTLSSADCNFTWDCPLLTLGKGDWEILQKTAKKLPAGNFCEKSVLFLVLSSKTADRRLRLFCRKAPRIGTKGTADNCRESTG